MDKRKFQDGYDEELDFEGDVVIGAFMMTRSQILKELGEDLYDQGLDEHIERLKEQHGEVVTQEYPAPIAYFYNQVLNAYDHNNHRLQLLRSTWESLIYVLYALVLAEVQNKQFNISQVRIFNNEAIRPNHRGLLSDKLGFKMETTKQIVEYDQNNNNVLEVSAVLDVSVIETLMALNQERNSFSHISALSEPEALKRFEELAPIVDNILFDLYFLQNVSLLRFVQNNGSVTNLRFNRFDGHSLQKHNYNKELTGEELSQCLASLKDDIILIEFVDTLLIASPFIHFATEGGHTKLCYFKGVDKDTQNLKFEIIGGTEREVSIPQASLLNGIHNQLGSLL